jgi:hypothetical protein
MIPISEIRCKCGRVWRVEDGDKWIQREPGKIICKCGQPIASWSGSREYRAALVKGLPEDEGLHKPPCTYE